MLHSRYAKIFTAFTIRIFSHRTENFINYFVYFTGSFLEKTSGPKYWHECIVVRVLRWKRGRLNVASQHISVRLCALSRLLSLVHIVLTTTNRTGNHPETKITSSSVNFSYHDVNNSAVCSARSPFHPPFQASYLAVLH